MAVPLTPATSTDRVLRQLEQERKEESDARATVWAFLWILFGFKFITIGIIWYVAAGSGESIAMIAATTWYWMVIPILAISGPLLVRWRMIKLRRKREQLKQSEWSTKPDDLLDQVPQATGRDGPGQPWL